MSTRSWPSTPAILAFVVLAAGQSLALAQTYNTAFGTGALGSNPGGDFNSAFGYGALFSDSSGDQNTATGNRALYSNTTGGNNTATGGKALYKNTTGNGNTATGHIALVSNTSGRYNVAIGEASLFSNKTGNSNTAAGRNALQNNASGSGNVAIGQYALLYSVAGSNNIGVGQNAGLDVTNGSNNIEIGTVGHQADDGFIRVGTPGLHTNTYLAGVYGTNVTGGVPVMVTATGQLGVVSSSRRYKEDIHSMGDTSERLLKLHPVTFRYKKPDEGGQQPVQYGLVAEEVAKVMPELVVYNEKDQPETVAYQALTPLLLNEVQKQHVELVALRAQGAELAALRAEVEALRRLTAQLAADGHR